MEKLIHTSDGRLKAEDPFFRPGIKIRVPSNWKNDGHGFGYINEATIVATRKLRELGPRGPGPENRYQRHKHHYYSISPHGHPNVHGPQDRLEIVE